MNKFIVGIPYTNCEYESEIPCTTEAEAVAVACGAWLGGRKCLVFMQDAGFLAALNVIIGLSRTYDIEIESAINFRETPEHHKLTYWATRNIIEANPSNKKNF